MRRRSDKNQKQIVDDLRKCGVWVKVLSNEGHGFPDLFCCYRGVLFLLEVKDGEKATFTPDQKKFHAEFPGKIFVIRHLEEIPHLLREVACYINRETIKITNGAVEMNAA
jgi:hypothetical protein